MHDPEVVDGERRELVTPDGILEWREGWRTRMGGGRRKHVYAGRLNGEPLDDDLRARLRAARVDLGPLFG